jgi:hypothetical protein
MQVGIKLQNFDFAEPGIVQGAKGGAYIGAANKGAAAAVNDNFGVVRQGFDGLGQKLDAFLFGTRSSEGRFGDVRSLEKYREADVNDLWRGASFQFAREFGRGKYVGGGPWI